MSIRIITPIAGHTERARRLYMASFPPEERRPWELIVSPLQPEGPQLRMIMDSAGEFAGMVTFWKFPHFVYVEHFAVEPSRRGSGIGGEAISRLVSDMALPVVLEVERPSVDEPLTGRRIGFYERNGFKILPYNYIQPPYAPGLPEVPLLLMATDASLDPHEISRRLHREVYGADDDL